MTVADLQDPASVVRGYTLLSTLFESEHTRICRAQRDADGMPVILKLLGRGYGSREAVARLHNEFEIIRRIDSEHVVRGYALARAANAPVVVMEDIGGESLDRIAANRRFSLEDCLTIGIAVSAGLAELHAAGIVHRDINPSNIVYNERTGALNIIDFGVSSWLDSEQAGVIAARVVPGTLGYMSPEQTGRMNRAMDYRTDFYSLGVTLYELLTGKPLFEVEDAIEWFHCHIAREPVPPAELDPNIPRQVSDIVMKLMAKTAENRYQSALGIVADLRRCLDGLRETGGRVDEFPLAQQDVPERFQMPQRLYGRDREVAELMSAFDRARGGVALALVTGASGIGKSRLINELHKPVTERRGYFISGKFDQLHRDVPYSALIAALRDLVRQLLSETAQQLAEWKTRLLEALGGNGQLIVDLIPELALVVGPQPPVPSLPPREAEQRFRLTMLEFVQVFGRKEHPLVLVLDDLQWADAGTLKLADLLIDSNEQGHMLLIGAFRDNEVQPGHPLLDVLTSLRNAGVPTTAVSLGPLHLPDLCLMLADALRAPAEAVVPLARLVEEKTEGNPFFVDEFLRAMHRQGLIDFSPEAHRWTWDLDRIAAQQSTDNVVDLMTHKLRKLPPETQRLLELGACAGNRFPLATLAVMAESAPAAVADALRAATAERLLAVVRDGYQLIELDQSSDVADLTVEYAFSHDRIQQTAYDLLDPQQREAAHLRIGTLLLSRLSAAERDENLFAIVNHLNYATRLIEGVAERDRLARLNLAAGKRAKRAASYQIAFGYLQRALTVVDDGIWESDYPFALELYAEAVEAAYLNADYGALEELLAVAFRHARSLLDRVGLYEVQILALVARGELMPAINIAKRVLAQLGHRYPARPNKLHVALKLLALKRRLGGSWNTEPLRHLPRMTDPMELAAGRIGASIGNAAMFNQPMLVPLMVIHSVSMALEHGNSPATATGCSALGMILAGSLGKVDAGDAFGKLGIDICGDLQDPRSAGRAQHIYSSLVQYWKDPLYQTLDGLRKAMRLCLENGEFQYAIHASALYGKYALHAGVELDRLEQETLADIQTFRALRQDPLLHHHACSHQTLLNLMGRSHDPRRLVGEAYDIDKALPLHREAKDLILVHGALGSEILLRYCFDRDGDDDELVELCDSMGEATSAVGFYNASWFTFMNTLVRLRAAGNAEGARRRQLLKQAARGQAQLQRFSRRCPDNYRNKYHLVAAERLRVEGRDFEAHAEYDRAVARSREHGFLHEQALANELCGRMHMAAGRTTLGLPYLREARELYRRWGAVAKVRHLEDRYAQLATSSRSTTARTAVAPLEGVDITSLMKALKAIADERVHSRMVAAVIGTALEFAGAQRGVLALRNPRGELCIEAEAEVDDGEPRILQSQPLAQSRNVAQAVVNYVTRTRSGLVVHDAASGDSQIPGLNLDSHVIRDQVKSILCLPLVAGTGSEAELMGLLYLENNRVTNCFTDQRFGTLEIICVAAAGRLELSRKAAVDGLTDLFNHDYFQNMLKQEIATSNRHRRELSLILLDIDHFKQVNDTWGHQVGDRVLREVADIIKLSSREGDTVARYGGEEIAVILPATGREEARTVAERLRRAVESHTTEAGAARVAVTVSLGVAAIDLLTNDASGLVQQADAALYRSKAEGRNRVTVAEARIR